MKLLSGVNSQGIHDQRSSKARGEGENRNSSFFIILINPLDSQPQLLKLKLILINPFCIEIQRTSKQTRLSLQSK